MQKDIKKEWTFPLIVIDIWGMDSTCTFIAQIAYRKASMQM